ncbi:UxaA family hydrolase [Roseateles sp. BYS180W]|uniref:UxaA family hydrolase n=1 Tax=Roseateles rivi TaxID=3299028 RepID=A0ABW7FWE8_9BURK
MSQGAALLQLAPQDNCAIALRNLSAGEVIEFAGQTLRLGSAVPLGHKVALEAMAPGTKVLRWGSPIGSTTHAIAPGEHIHLHNLRSDYLPTYTLDAGQRFVSDSSKAAP